MPRDSLCYIPHTQWYLTSSAVLGGCATHFRTSQTDATPRTTHSSRLSRLLDLYTDTNSQRLMCVLSLHWSTQQRLPTSTDRQAPGGCALAHRRSRLTWREESNVCSLQVFLCSSSERERAAPDAFTFPRNMRLSIWRVCGCSRLRRRIRPIQ